MSRLGAADLAATTLTAVYTVADRRSVKKALINVCNRNATPVTVRLAIIDGAVGAVNAADYIEYDTPLAANSSLERSDLTLGRGDTIAAYASDTGVSVVVTGELQG